MKTLLLICSLFAGHHQHQFGKAVPEKTTHDVAKVIANPKKFAGKKMVVEGTIFRVCKAKGCWMELTTNKPSKQTIFVKFGNHSFFLPKDSASKKARVAGVIKGRKMRASEAEHLKSDGKNNAKPGKVYELIASGVTLIDTSHAHDKH